MASVRIEHTYNCSVDTFWDKLFFDEEYNRRLFKEALEFPGYEETKKEDKGDVVERVVAVSPKLGDMPGPLKKVVGDNVSYKEVGKFDKKSKRYSIEIVPNKLADKLHIKGELWCEPQGDDKCKRIFSAEVKAKIFGVGGLLEKRVIADMEHSYAAGAKFTNEYLAEKGL